MKTILIKILTRGATLNPQNMVVRSALHQMGYTQIQEIRVERYCRIEVEDDVDTDELTDQLGEDLKGNRLPTMFNAITDIFEIEVVS